MDRKHVYSSFVSLFCREILPSKRNFNRVYFGSGTSSNPKILPVGYLNNYLEYAKNEIIPEKKDLASTNTLTNREYCAINLLS